MVNKICNGVLGAFAGDQQEVPRLARLEGADGSAGAVDEIMHAGALPDGKGPALADDDVELVGIDAVDARALDPVDVLHHATGAAGIEADERAAKLDADGGEH